MLFENREDQLIPSDKMASAGDSKEGMLNFVESVRHVLHSTFIETSWLYFWTDGRGRVVWCNLREDSDENLTEDKEVQTELEASVAPNIPIIMTPSSQYSAKVPEEKKTPSKPDGPARSMEECIEISRKVFI